MLVLVLVESIVLMFRAPGTIDVVVVVTFLSCGCAPLKDSGVEEVRVVTLLVVMRDDEGVLSWDKMRALWPLGRYSCVNMGICCSCG